MKISLAAGIALLAAFLVQPITLLLASSLKIAPSSFQSASELASIMGAIFTSGGLIVALLSLYTMANMDKASENAVERTFQTVPQRIDERIRTFMEAYSYLEEARRLWSQYKYQALQDIEGFVLRAEETEPTLRNLNTWSGKLFFQSARASYLREHAPDGSYRDCPPNTERPALAVKALPRLESGFLHAPNDDEKALLAFCIAQLHAILGDHPNSVAGWIEKARAQGKTPEINGITALTLIASCRDERGVQHILKACHVDVMTPQQVQEILEALKSKENKMTQAFVVLARSRLTLQNPPVSPALLIFRTVDKWNNAFVEWCAREQLYIGTVRGGIPPFPDFSAQLGVHPQNPPFMVLGELIEEVMKQFVVVAPFNFEPFEMTF